MRPAQLKSVPLVFLTRSAMAVTERLSKRLRTSRRSWDVAMASGFAFTLNVFNRIFSARDRRSALLGILSFSAILGITTPDAPLSKGSAPTVVTDNRIKTVGMKYIISFKCLRNMESPPLFPAIKCLMSTLCPKMCPIWSVLPDRPSALTSHPVYAKPNDFVKPLDFPSAIGRQVVDPFPVATPASTRFCT